MLPFTRQFAAYPARTASGHAKMPPRALRCLSDQALNALGALLLKAEQWCGWPSERLVCLLARIPKPDGGARVTEEYKCQPEETLGLARSSGTGGRV